MTLRRRLLLALFGLAVAIAPSATVRVVAVVAVVASRDGGPKAQDGKGGPPPEKRAPAIRKVRAVVLKDAAAREFTLEIRAEDREPEPEADDAADFGRASPRPLPRAVTTRDSFQPLPAPAAPPGDVRAGLIDLPPPNARTA